jgi:hypothetical protein
MLVWTSTIVTAGFRSVPQSIEETVGTIPRLSHIRLLPNPSQFIGPTLQSLDTESVVKITYGENYHVPRSLAM